jgi:eukaryotic-like serine/threonine-protein kinase
MHDDVSPQDQPTASIQPHRPDGDMLPAAPLSPGGAIERQGDTIGPYTLLQTLGEGGFGVVYLAERREPMVQRVAIKIIKPGMDSKAVIARFEQERQALAVMDHPCVAKVFDGGMTKTGRPYFVMEYVKGEPITGFADRARLTIRQRLELFTSVCDAVQHAHMKGIIHRDIKPSNILVAHAGEGASYVVKVIDFGVAKAISHSLTDKTIFTERGQVIGTPEYMSPEQVAGEIDVDTRADVYSLGVLLYELLTGELPFDSRELRKAAMAEIQRIIREVTPPKPSTRLMQLAGDRTTTIAQSRSATRDRLTSELRRELDWIPLMALRKERERRYPSPQALAEDVHRYLDGRPLHAAPESRAYLAKKFVRRNKVQVFATGAVFVALSAGLALALWQRGEAIVARDAEATQRARADERAEAAIKAEAAATSARDAERERADQLKKVSDFQSTMLVRINTKVAGEGLMADVRERFAAALEKAGIPETERTTRVETMRQELARVNATDAAAAMIDRTILRPAIKTIDEQFKNDLATDASLRQALATLYRAIGLYEAAFPLQESSLVTRRRVLGEEHPDTLSSISNMGTLLRAQGKLDQAEPYLLESLDKARRVLGEEHLDTLISINNMGFLLESQGRIAEAEPYYRESLEKRRRVLGEDHPSVLNVLNNLGRLLESGGKLHEAETLYREALEKSRRIRGEEHPTTLISMSNVGGLLWSQGKLAEAEPIVREVLEKRRRVFGEEHPDTLTSISNMGLLLQERGRLQEAESYLREALQKYRRVLGVEHPYTLISMNNMGQLLESQGKLQDAETLYQEALEVSRRVLGNEHPDTLLVIHNMGGVLESQGMLQEAELLYRELLETSRRVLGEEHPHILRSINSMGTLLYSQGKLAEAEPYLREALEKCRRVLDEEHPKTLQIVSNLGALFQSQGKLAEAEPLYREALEKRRRVLGEEHPDTLSSISNLGTLLQAQGKHQETLDLLAPIEPAARTAFTGGNARRLAGLLTTLGRARIGLGFDSDRFSLAEANLLEAHPIYMAAKDRGPTHKDTLACVQGLVDLYTAWHDAEPGKGYDAKAAEWKAKLPPADSADTVPAKDKPTNATSPSR